MSPSDELEEMLLDLTTQVASLRDLVLRPDYSNFEDDAKTYDFIVSRVNKMLNIAKAWIMKLEHDVRTQQEQERQRAQEYGWGGWGASALTRPAVESRGEFDLLLRGVERVKMGVFFAVEGNVMVGIETVKQGVRGFEGWV
ncbi:hypothetical protein QC761_403488 [Podospora bellae-mahoneyi]|uniref:Uncharacterized protein n=1 Tax=Podospora bellae-mahoneyi TaxID=2093777 RepID=A0ABR0FIG7_9PEZI|nr:hypothetical protein QC761_403488 [Podospora bellae-mahoneyi]